MDPKGPEWTRMDPNGPKWAHVLHYVKLMNRDSPEDSDYTMDLPITRFKDILWIVLWIFLWTLMALIKALKGPE